MPQDAFTLKFLCEELNSRFKGGKVNRIVQPDNDGIIFTVYTGVKTENLLISVNPSSPRIGVFERGDGPLTAPNFCMLLRKHLLSSEIESISLIGFDRIVKIDFLPSKEFFDSEKKSLFVELMGRYSNIILTENGKVLGGNRGINFFDNGVRPLIVGKPYKYPPVGDKKLPDDKRLIEYFNGFNGENLPEFIASGVQGLAVSTAKEIEKEYFDTHDSFDPSELFSFLNNFIKSHPKTPCVYTENGTVKDVCVFPYGDISGEIKNFKSLTEAEDFYFTQKERVKTIRDKRDRLNKIVFADVKKVKKKLNAICAREKDASSCEDDKLKGELILANIYKIPNGAKSCTLFNYYDNTEITVDLDENLSASKNAEKYFKKYNKEKRTLTALIPQKQTAESELEYLNALLDEISLAENVEDLDSVKEELIGYGLMTVQNPSKKKKETTLGYRRYSYGGYTIKVGRNNTENDKLTFTSKPDDMWVHAKDYHSSHLIIENGINADEKVIVKAAEICAYYSRGRNGGKTEIVYTLKKFVKKPSKSKPGFCTYTDFKSVTVNPDKHEELLIYN